MAPGNKETPKPAAPARTGHSPTDRRASINQTLTEQAKAGRVPLKNIRVRAIRTGYYEHIRRREGDVFDLVPRQGFTNEVVREAGKRPRKVQKPYVLTAEDQFSVEWMEEVSPRTPLTTSTANDEIRRQHDEILALKRPASGRDAAGEELEELPPDAGDELPEQPASGGKAETGNLDPLGADPTGRE